MHNERYSSVIFDLDGTLVDSAPSILCALDHAFTVCGVEPALAPTKAIIGPPLSETIMLLASDRADEEQQARIRAAFIEFYDDVAYRNTVSFSGVEIMLQRLRHHGYDLYLATNKRIAPTLKIIEQMGWSKLFNEVYAIDSVTPAFANKASMLSGLLKSAQLKPTKSVYVGDRDEDGVAALANSMEFIFAAWGYNTGHERDWHFVRTPQELLG